jgi:hypothetical protein
LFKMSIVISSLSIQCVFFSHFWQSYDPSPDCVNYFFVYFLFVSQQICSNYNINIFICYRICPYNVALC